MSRLFRFVLLAGFLAFLPSARAENWPEFRGPGRQGISGEKNLPIKWGKSENIAWSSAVPGVSWSTPIVWDNRVFLTTATDEGQSCRVLALDAEIGRAHV